MTTDQVQNLALGFFVLLILIYLFSRRRPGD
jgi:hypothetical protein